MSWIAIVIFGWLAAMAIILAFLAGAAMLNDRWDRSSDEQLEQACWEERRAA